MDAFRLAPCGPLRGRLRVPGDKSVTHRGLMLLALAEGEGPVKGWCLVCAGGYPLGWAKGAGPVLKNKYYPGWRWM